MTTVGSTPPPPQMPVGRGWRSLGMFAVIFGMIVFGVLGWSAYSRYMSKDEPTAEKPQFNVYTPPDMPRIKADSGYRKEPPPSPPPAAPAPAPPPVQQSQRQTEVKELPKPLLSGVVGTMAPDIEQPADARLSASKQSLPGKEPEYRPGGKDGNNSQWLTEAGTHGLDFVTQPFMPPISDVMIQTGVTIKARLLHKASSALPGDVVAMITNRVCDTPTGRNLVIPPNTKLFGRYNDSIAYGQDVVQLAWTRILFPDGSSQNIGSMEGVDNEGAAGVQGHLNRHIGGLAAAIAISSFSTLISQSGQFIQGNDSSGQTNIGIVGGSAAGRTTGDIGERIAEKELNRPNTIELCRTRDDPTCNVAVLVSKDIALPSRGDCL